MYIAGLEITNYFCEMSLVLLTHLSDLLISSADILRCFNSNMSYSV